MLSNLNKKTQQSLFLGIKSLENNIVEIDKMIETLIISKKLFNILFKKSNRNLIALAAQKNNFSNGPGQFKFKKQQWKSWIYSNQHDTNEKIITNSFENKVIIGNKKQFKNVPSLKN